MSGGLVAVTVAVSAGAAWGVGLTAFRGRQLIRSILSAMPRCPTASGLHVIQRVTRQRKEPGPGRCPYWLAPGTAQHRQLTAYSDTGWLGIESLPGDGPDVILARAQLPDRGVAVGCDGDNSVSSLRVKFGSRGVITHAGAA